MSTNCMWCATAKRTGIDLLCNSCRNRKHYRPVNIDVATRKLLDIAYSHGHTPGMCCDAEGGECGICGVLDCPHGDPLHYHHDGCPSCYDPKTDSGGPV